LFGLVPRFSHPPAWSALTRGRAGPAAFCGLPRNDRRAGGPGEGLGFWRCVGRRGWRSLLVGRPAASVWMQAPWDGGSPHPPTRRASFAGPVAQRPRLSTRLVNRRATRHSTGYLPPPRFTTRPAPSAGPPSAPPTSARGRPAGGSGRGTNKVCWGLAWRVARPALSARPARPCKINGVRSRCVYTGTRQGGYSPPGVGWGGSRGPEGGAPAEVLRGGPPPGTSAGGWRRRHPRHDPPLTSRIKGVYSRCVYTGTRQGGY
jgi:hypothetical protein